MPKLSMPGALLVGDAGGMVDTAALKGVHHCINSGKLAAEAIYRRAQDRRDSLERLRADDRGLGDRQGAVRGAQHASAVPEGLPQGRRRSSTSAIATKGKLPPGRLPGTATTRSRCSSATRTGATRDRTARDTFDKLSSVFITGNATRDDAPNHIRVQKNVPREVAETWKWMCPAGVYEIPEDAPEPARST